MPDRPASPPGSRPRPTPAGEVAPGRAARARLHAALADEVRLAVVDELAVSDRSPAELARRLDVAPSLLAHHLRVLEEAGIVRRTRSAGDGRRRYLHLVGCRLPTGPRPRPLAARAVVFVCTANAARSPTAAALWNRVSPVPATSAGTRPAPAVHPGAVRAARRAGLDVSGWRPRRLRSDLVARAVVVTVCDLAHEHLRDIRSGSPVEVIHWAVPDPAADASPDAFDAALGELSRRVEALARHVSAAGGSDPPEPAQTRGTP